VGADSVLVYTLRVLADGLVFSLRFSVPRTEYPTHMLLELSGCMFTGHVHSVLLVRVCKTSMLNAEVMVSILRHLFK